MPPSVSLTSGMSGVLKKLDNFLNVRKLPGILRMPEQAPLGRSHRRTGYGMRVEVEELLRASPSVCKHGAVCACTSSA